MAFLSINLTRFWFINYQITTIKIFQLRENENIQGRLNNYYSYINM